MKRIIAFSSSLPLVCVTFQRFMRDSSNNISRLIFKCCSQKQETDSFTPLVFCDEGSGLAGVKQIESRESILIMCVNAIMSGNNHAIFPCHVTNKHVSKSLFFAQIVRILIFTVINHPVISVSIFVVCQSNNNVS